MNTFLNYLIEANLGLIFFYGIYWIVLQREDQFTFKRTYLLASVLASLVFPLFTIGTTTSIIPSLSQTAAVLWLPEIVVYANDSAQAEVGSIFFNWSWVTYTYLFVVVCTLTLFLIRISSLIILFKKSTHYTWKNYTVTESHKVQGVFSFFHFIFLSPGERLAETEKQEILRHEEVHIKKLHSLDIILMQLLGIVFWFNPIIRFYKKSLVQVHEFEADARSVEGHDVDEYCSLLAKVALRNNGYVLANHFTNSLTLKRITMMKTVRRKIKNWKVLAAACTLPLFFFVVACQDQVANVEEINNNSKSDVIYPIEVQNALTQLKNANPDSELIVIEKNKTGEQILETLNQDNISLIQAQGYKNQFAIISQGATILKRKNSKVEVLSVVEQSAEPVGGMPQFYDYIGANLKYPEQARKMGVEGRVFVEFVVNEDGSISDVKTVKGIGAGCDMEAARVVALSKAWNPAKNKGQMVKQRLVVPIIFKLG